MNVAPTTAPHDQEVTLLDQIRWVVSGQRVDDVLTVALMLLMQCVVQKTPDKNTALFALDKLYQATARHIDADYEELKSEANREVFQQ